MANKRKTDTYLRYMVAINNLTQENGFPPTIREIASKTDRGNTSVRQALLFMRDHNMAEYEDGIARTARLTEHGKAFVDWQSCRIKE